MSYADLLNEHRFETSPSRINSLITCFTKVGHEPFNSAIYTPTAPRLHHYGILRLVRDVLHISGFLVTDVLGQIVQIVLNRVAPLAALLVDPLWELLAHMHIVVNLGQT